jgi:hypothetical protein
VQLTCFFFFFLFLYSVKKNSAKAISHLASEEHLKKLKHFMWKYGGGMDRVDTFRISEADAAKVSAKFVVLF